MINMQLRKIFEDTVKAPPDDIKYIFLTDTEAYPANLLLDGCLPVYLTASPEENAFTTEEFLSCLADNVPNSYAFYYIPICGASRNKELQAALKASFFKYSADAWKSFSGRDKNSDYYIQHPDEFRQMAAGFIKRCEGGKEPREFVLASTTHGRYMPADFTDSGNAAVFTAEHKGKLIFVRALGWLYWTDKKWECNDLKAIKYGKDMAGAMLEQATAELIEARKTVTIAESTEEPEKIAAAKKVEAGAKAFQRHALNTRMAPAIDRMLKLSQPELHIELDKLDADPFALNTPGGIVDLKTGAIIAHDPGRLCANISKVGPDKVNLSMWKEFLAIVTCGDVELEDFLQQVAGMAAIGKVFTEKVTIAYGDGRNGKSTFFNALAAVLGDYAGTIAAEVLTTDKQNKGASLAELKGKQLVIAAELEEGKRLSTSVLKQLASTDPINAERKYKDPETFTPSHSVVLYTNHKPKVGSNDTGTWRRIALIPFNAKIPAAQEVKNYCDELVEKAGGSILSWIIEGAAKFHQNGHKLITPVVVANATAQYRDDNDWLSTFIDERCEIGIGMKEKAGVLYAAYRGWAERNGDYVRNNGDFRDELERRDYSNHKEKQGTYWHGIRLLEPYEINPFTAGYSG